VAYAESTFLPLRRRAAKTLRPFFVLMRLRNPWSFLRLRLFGLNVGFIPYTPPSSKGILSHYKEICLKSQADPAAPSKEKYPHKTISRPVDIILSTLAHFDKVIYSLYTKYRGVNTCPTPVVVFVDKCEKTIDTMPFICYYVFVLERA
jgi:hypothetical protein